MDDYKQLFEAYVAEMRQAQAAALAWWETLLIREQQASGSAEVAEEALEKRWPLGAVSHPFVIAAFRKWALEVQALNDEAESDSDEDADEDDADEADWGSEDAVRDEPVQDLATLEAPVEPRDLLIEMLAGRADDLSEFLADFVFTPLGLDKEDRWV
ncbi:MAG TPA: hypothetical protein VGE16_05215 [Albitalea sp.]